ncbi:type II RES/Xre toxin-antitoxin system antitoxin [Pedobacter endophyticus]|uniref:Antitoxin Xre-like helix-turn-helix domain-containing protein n=1 Tax=Pedobacter endophyticus TaxID=2789740 RepID=A0A7U3Q332_9SPHI|nr:antitoxin Xre-like helix-turn-helix domain-containing protein [Pedobacter endophyticus]QPH37645.1 hypothetical protein IZT61_11010 [Pedobacter endophyticus]
MKKIKYHQQEAHILIASEPEVLYRKTTSGLLFSIKKFEVLSSRLPFSQAEWADILHISDRTLQRYIKEDKPFEGLFAEHLLQLENMAALALEIFDKPETVKQWLLSPKRVLDQTLDFSALKSFWGVKLISNELGRMAYGVYI